MFSFILIVNLGVINIEIEEVKRLSPTSTVLRELYLKSGNQCAFPDCNERMIHTDGTFIGQVCHIEAAMPDGQRFNINQNNEDRRKFSNLMLMCYKHHKVTDNISEYSLERLQQIKKSHESKFEDIVEKLHKSVEDHTSKQISFYPKSLSKINTVLNWGNNPNELKDMITEVNEWIDKLKKLTPDNRKVFIIMLQRVMGNTKKVIPLNEIQSVTNLGAKNFHEHYSILHRYGFIGIAEEDEDYNYSYVCDLNEWNSGWPFWEDLIVYVAKTSYSFDEIILYLNFSLLD